MKCKCMLLGTLVLAVAASAPAQDDPKLEVTGEYSYVRFNPTLPRIQNKSFNGGGFEAAYYFRGALGFKADLLFYGSTTFTTTFPTTITRVGVIPAGTYSSNGSFQTYLFGPILKVRLHRLEPFGEVLFGVAHTNAYANLSTVIARAPASTFTVQGSQTPFALAAGAGVDLPFKKSFAIRLGEVDYLLTRFTNPLTQTNNQNNFRYAGGFQFRLGGH